MNVSMLDYQVRASETELESVLPAAAKDRFQAQPVLLALLYRANSLSVKSGSVSAAAASAFQTGENPKDKLMLPLGEVLHEVALLCTLLGIPLSELARYDVQRRKHG